MAARGAGAATGDAVVGFLRSTPSAPFQNLVVAFGQGLKEEGLSRDRTLLSIIAMRIIGSIDCRLWWLFDSPTGG